MSSVNFDPSVGGDNSTVTDDANAATGLAAGGFKTRLVPALSQFVAIALWVKTRALQVAQYAQDAANAAADSIAAAGAASNFASNAQNIAANMAASMTGTSVTNTVLSGGVKTFATQVGKQFTVNSYVLVSQQAAPTNYMYGRVTAYAGGNLTVNVSVIAGIGGTYADWDILVSGVQGPAGVAVGSDWLIKTAAYTAGKGEKIAVDTSAGAISITLPPGPLAGHSVDFSDAGGAFATNNLTILRNGKTIMGLAEDMVVSTNGSTFSLVYSGNTWRVI